MTTSEDRYRFLFDANPIPMWVFDRETLRFLMVNDAAVRQYGFPRDEFLTLTILDIRPPEEAAGLAEELRHRPPGPVIAGSIRRHRRKDGTDFDAEVSSQEVTFEGRTVLLAMAVDVSERKRSEEAQARLVRELTAALAEVKTLHGLLPICANCKRVRTHEGGWEQIESYVREHTDADFSHGLCPECAVKLYGKLP
ncbi:MAG: PAS domain S-box protein [Gemmatimonadales bacterium]